MSRAENLIINGSGSYGGGRYAKISIRGDGTIVHDVECSAFHVYGTSHSEASVKAGKVKVLGEAEIKGDIEAQETTIMGTVEIGGRARMEKIKLYGTLDVGESLNGEKATIKGSLSVEGDVEFETFESSGGFDIKGLLSADDIKVSLSYGESRAEEIGGGKITVKRGAWLIPFTNISLSKKVGFLEVKVIEGDDVYLENTKADIVRGNRVYIGSGCKIGLVEYTTDLRCDQNASIQTKEKR